MPRKTTEELGLREVGGGTAVLERDTSSPTETEPVPGRRRLPEELGLREVGVPVTGPDAPYRPPRMVSPPSPVSTPSRQQLFPRPSQAPQIQPPVGTSTMAEPQVQTVAPVAPSVSYTERPVAPQPLRAKGPVPGQVVPLDVQARGVAPVQGQELDITVPFNTPIRHLPASMVSPFKAPYGTTPEQAKPAIPPVTAKQEPLVQSPYGAPIGKAVEQAYGAVAGPNTIPGRMREMVTPGGFRSDIAMQTPLVDLAQFAPQDQPLIQGVAEQIAALTSPESVMFLAGSGMLGRLAKGPMGRAVSLGFTVDMLDEFPEQGARFREAIDAGDVDSAERILGQMLVQGGMAGLAGAHAQGLGGKLYKGFPQAREAVRKTGEFFGLRPRAEPKTGQILTDQAPTRGQRLLPEGEAFIEDPLRPEPKVEVPRPGQKQIAKPRGEPVESRPGVYDIGSGMGGQSYNVVFPNGDQTTVTVSPKEGKPTLEARVTEEYRKRGLEAPGEFVPQPAEKQWLPAEPERGLPPAPKAVEMEEVRRETEEPKVETQGALAETKPAISETGDRVIDEHGSTWIVEGGGVSKKSGKEFPKLLVMLDEQGNQTGAIYDLNSSEAKAVISKGEVSKGEGVTEAGAAGWIPEPMEKTWIPGHKAKLKAAEPYVEDLITQKEKAEEQRDVARRELEVDERTGYGSARALKRALPAAELDPQTEIASLDLANLKARNDLDSPAAGDTEIKAAADAINQAAKELGIPPRVFAPKGDELYAIGPKGKMQGVVDRAIELYGERAIGDSEFSNFVRGGVGASLADADAAMGVQKTAETGKKFRPTATRPLAPTEPSPPAEPKVETPQKPTAAAPPEGAAQTAPGGKLKKPTPAGKVEGIKLPKGISLHSRGAIQQGAATGDPGAEMFYLNVEGGPTDIDFTVGPGEELQTKVDDVLHRWKLGPVPEPKVEAPKPKPEGKTTPSVIAKTSQGDRGVMRLEYRNEDGVQVGQAHLMGELIGDIYVEPEWRKKGFGQAILKDLVARGGKVTTSTNDAGKALLKSSGLDLPLEDSYKPEPVVEAPKPKKPAKTPVSGREKVADHLTDEDETLLRSSFLFGLEKPAGKVVRGAARWLRGVIDDLRTNWPPGGEVAVRSAVGERLQSRFNAAAKRAQRLAETFNSTNEKFKIAYEQVERISEKGTIEKEDRPRFREGTQPARTETEEFRFSEKDIERSGADLVGLVRELKDAERAFEVDADPDSAAKVAAARKAAEDAVKRWQVYRSAAGRAVQSFNRPIPGDIIQGLREAGILIDGVKQRLPLDENIVRSVANWDKLTSTEKLQVGKDLVNSFRLNLFSVTSWTLDFIGNAAEMGAQTSEALGRDLFQVVKGNPTLPSLRAMMRALRVGSEGLLTATKTGRKIASKMGGSQGLRNLVGRQTELPQSVREGLGSSVSGEILPQQGVFWSRTSTTGSIYDFMKGAPLYAKGLVDTTAKRIGALSTIYREANIEASRRGLTGLDRQQFLHEFSENPPEETVLRAIENGRKAGFDRVLSKMEENIGNSSTARLLVDVFARWPFQFSRWGAEMLGFNYGLLKRITASRAKGTPPDPRLGEDIAGYLFKTAAGLGGLYLLNKLYDQVDFNSMESVDKDGNRRRLSNRDPIPTGLWFLSVLKGDMAKATGALRHASIPFARLLAGEGGLLGGMVQSYLRAARNPTGDPRELRQVLEDTINRAIPGQALLSALKTVFDPAIREGIGANLPGISLTKPAVINPATGGPLKPRQRVLGVEMRSIAGTPIPGATRVLDPVTKLLNRYGLQVYRGPRSPVAGYPAGSVPENLRREWQQEFGRLRNHLLLPLTQFEGRSEEETRKRIQSEDARAARLTTELMSRLYGKQRLERKPTLRELRRPQMYQEPKVQPVERQSRQEPQVQPVR